jgi:hypothetical protein
MSAASVALIFAGIASTQAPAPRAKEPATPEVLKAEIEALIPAKHAWREIQWLTCPLQALKESRAHKKPVITWVFLGLPSDERC